MKRAVIIFVLGLALSGVAFCGFYFLGSAAHRGLRKSSIPELAWLKKEFHLNEAEFARITELHAAYLPQCEERCRRIAAKNAELKDLLGRTDTVTPEVEQKLADAAQIRVECQTAMLKHFYDVSRTMPPEQGKRYLAWIQEKTFLADGAMSHATDSPRPAHDLHTQ